MAQANPFQDYTKMFAEFKAPGVNVNHLFSIQRRNIEALTSANQLIAEGVQAASRRQAELARSNVETVLKTAKEMMVNGSPEINTSKQAELAKQMFESALSNLREVSELMTRSSFEAFDLLNKRAAQSVEELQQAA